MIKTDFLLDTFKTLLAKQHRLPQLAILGLLCGIFCGLFISLFRFAIDLPLSFFLPVAETHTVENFEGLSTEMRFLLPSIGASMLALIITYWPAISAKVGVSNLLEHMAYHKGYISGKNLISQFILATIALISGQSVGKEGPAIYMGAALASKISQLLNIPYNIHRLLLACGAAAAISAAFNTPLAGVIFAIEVILLGYTIAGFTPIIVAAVSSSLITQLIFSSDPIFHTLSFDLLDHYEILWILFLGVITGCLAALFIMLMTNIKLNNSWPLNYKLVIAGLLTGLVAIYYPQVMGTGYDTILASLNGELGIKLLFGVLIAKLLLTPIILGLGMPAGMIGPSIFIGAIIGAILGIYGGYFVDSPISDVGLYAMLGMGAMMAAVLNAPLAALIALLELTYNPNIIFPAMIAIVTANLTTRYVFKMPSAFLSSLKNPFTYQNIQYLNYKLTTTPISDLANPNFSIFETHNSQSFTPPGITTQVPTWLLIRNSKKIEKIILYKDMLNFLDQNKQSALNIEDINQNLQIIHFTNANTEDTLDEALAKMNHHNCPLLCAINSENKVTGIVLKAQIEKYYDNN